MTEEKTKKLILRRYYPPMYRMGDPTNNVQAALDEMLRHLHTLESESTMMDVPQHSKDYCRRSVQIIKETLVCTVNHLNEDQNDT